MCSSKQQWFEAWDEVYATSADRYQQQIHDMMDMSLVQQQYHEYTNRVCEAGFGPDHDAYEAYWTRVFEYFRLQPVALDEQQSYN